MQEFIQAAASRLDISEESAKSATEKLLSFLKNQGEGDEIKQLIAKLPGAEELLNSSSPGSVSSGGGMMGGLASSLGNTLGGGGGALATLLGSGLDASQSVSFIKMLVDYAKQKVGPELVDQVAENVPALKSLL